MTDSLHYWLVMPAAGSGQRMQADRPKQYLPLLNQTVIEWSLRLFVDDARCQGIYLALAAHDSIWPTLALAAHPKIHTVHGGVDRATSVLAGLQALPVTAATDWVLVHDAARPCLTHDDLQALLATRTLGVGALLATPVTDTLKRAAQRGEARVPRVADTVSRQDLWRAQTPQMFRVHDLRHAMQQALANPAHGITDEASAMEQLGHQPLLVLGRADNIKVTVPEDLPLAEYVLRRAHHAGAEP